jgi:hypothetical protein
VLFKKIFATTLATVASFGCAATHAEMMTGPNIAFVGKVKSLDNIVKLEVEEKSWKCPKCTPQEQYVLEQIQDKTNIRDRNSLASILGNIKSESGFKAKICEGGARIKYRQCTSGGFGLIQWTSSGRYYGLGKFCKKYECDPNTLEGQTRYMINESQFQKYLSEFENPGFSISQYMVPSYYWLGWGVKGHREHYAHEYAGKLVWS